MALGLLGLLGITAPLYAQSGAPSGDPNSSAGVNLVTKEYPDGTRQVVRWVDLGAAGMDRGEEHGGAPKIVPFDAAKDGFVTAPSGSSSGNSATSMASGPKSGTPPSQEKIVPYQPDELYCRFQLGLTFLGDQVVESANGVSSNSDLSFSPGLRGMFELGGDLNEYLAIEGNIGAAWNTVNQGSNAALYQVPAMVGLLAKYPVHLQNEVLFIPYFGVDGGVRALLYESLSFVPNGQTSTYSGSPTYIDPTWQIRVGFLVGLQADWQLAFGYSYMGSWGTLGTSSNIDLGSLGTSTLELGFQTQF